MTAALKGGEWSAACPGRTLPPGKTRYPFYRRLGGPEDRSGRAENLVPTGIRSRTVQPVVSRYTDWAIRSTPESVHTRFSVEKGVLKETFSRVLWFRLSKSFNQYSIFIFFMPLLLEGRAVEAWEPVNKINTEIWSYIRPRPLLPIYFFNIVPLGLDVVKFTAAGIFKQITNMQPLNSISSCVEYTARSRNCKKRLLASSCLSVRPSVRPHGTTRLPLDGFSWNSIFEYFSKKTVDKIKFH